MKKLIYLQLMMALFAGLVTQSVNGQNVNVNPGAGSYSTLKDAFDAINLGTHTGAITVDIAGNTTETASAVLNESGVGGASYTSVLISPTGGVARTITGAFVGHLIDLNGADYVTIDGLNTGGNSLTITNSGLGASSVIRFTADATYNSVTNCTVLGSTGTSFGVVYFGAGTTSGNDNNMISYCNIGPAGTNLPLNGIYSMGTSTLIDNSSNTISNNNIYNFFNSSASASGMNINSYNSAWTISGNSFYQTASRTTTASGQYNGIFISNTGVNYNITGNFIGGSAPNATGTPWTFANNNYTNRFVGIAMASIGTTPVSSIQGNTIRNFVINTNSSATTANGNFSGIWCSSGNVNIGTITGNTIGSVTGNGSISITLATNSGGAANLISYSGTGLAAIENNIIGAIDLFGATTSISMGCQAIYVSGGVPTITGNLIGSTTTANSINAATVSTNATAQRMVGIQVTGTSTNSPITISNNTVANLTQAGTNATHYIRGIAFSGQGASLTSTINITNNTIFNLKGANALPGLGSAALGIVGVSWVGATASGYYASPNITGNTIYSLMATNTGAVQSNVCAITGSNIAGSAVIAKNKIYDLRNASTMAVAVTPPTASGIYIRANPTGSVSVYNNMISLGDGQTTNTQFLGIWNGFTGTLLNVYFNSVQIRGTAASGALPSFGFVRADFAPAVITTTVDIRNNIFENLRTGGTGKHYAIANDYGATASATGWSANASNYNLLNANASTVGYWTADQTFASWKTVSSCDGNSFSAMPVTFLDPTMADLHLNMGTTQTVLESGGVIVTGITVDYDNDTRPGPAGSVNGGGTFPDIGADEFDGVPQDLLAPTISYTPLLNTNSTAGRSLIVTVTDFSGVPTTSPGWPNLYWKKTGDLSYTAVEPISYLGSNQYQYSFGSAVSTGDVVSYYVVARDMVTPVANIGAFPALNAGTFTYDPPTAGVPPTNPSTYTITDVPLNGDYTVGVSVGSNYPTITAAVADLNLRGVSGQVRFLLNDATYISPSETFPIVIKVMNDNQPTLESPVTIKPNAEVISAITGASANSQIFSIRSNFIRIDGSNKSAGTTRDISITNTSTTGPQVVGITSTGTTPVIGSSVENCLLINGSTTSSAVVLSASDGSGGYFNNITVQNNSIQTAYVGIYAIAVAATGNGSGVNISGNDLNSSGTAALRLIGVYVQGFDGANVSYNNIGNMANTADASNLTGIWFATGTINSTISYNTISTISGTAGGPRGIVVSSAVSNANVNISGNTISGLTTGSTLIPYGMWIFSSTTGVVVEKNIIYNIKNTNAGGYSAIGIALGSSSTAANFTVKNNLIYDVAGYGWASSTTDNGYGINILSGGGYNLYYNSINLATNQTATTGVPACLIIGSTVAANSLDIRNNVFSIPATVGTNRYAVLCNAANTVFSFIDNNDYFTSGPNLGYMTSASVLDLAAWKTATGKDGNSISNDPLFTSPTNLLPLNTSPLVGAAVPLPGIVDDDIVQTSRSVTDPTIGAYELDPPFKTLSVKVFLEGPFDGGTNEMLTQLNDNALIPLGQPYSGAPWNYGGSENVPAIPAGVVDWVLVDLRDAATPEEAVPGTELSGGWPKAYFLLADGSIVDLDGTSLPNIGNPTVTNNLYVIVRHRNHVAIMSADGMTLSGGTTYGYDFSVDLTQAFGGAAGYKEMGTGSGIFGMVSGDADADGEISVIDFDKWATDFGQMAVYLQTDIDMDNEISVIDFDKWATNFGVNNPILGVLKQFKYKTQVPGNKFN